ncbi:response regulator [Microvirga subterranea]|uniref:Response regulator receiver domain-containing protein n=1 Tax=Microvirga subterranea TaxID=186651 RepID=A0A370H9V7_9HYPH|nr:response regulator [Microvirga subterranea]RDI53594.1 response regulator receiver domain-containing protein [Microvirga subterranea]
MPDLLSALRGRRILVVEDEYMMADDLQYDLEKAGAKVVGPVPSVADALRLLATEDAIDGAILDVNLRGEKAYPVADVLRDRGIPFVLATGYEQWALPGAYKDVPRCEKPVDLRHLARTLFG